ncbi:MAG TPA: SRPBCC family protein [Candidatus Aquilonibacter sp.]|nr:SRPBCC family protein [Candidatus Aquilonibacter sp.]
MRERRHTAARALGPTRRQVILGVAATSLSVSATAWGRAPQSNAEPPSTGADKLRTSLHQEIDLPADPHRIYAALLDSKQFAAFSGAPATIDPRPGGAFSIFGGQVTGRNVELMPHERIVQAWRPGSWPPGVYSIVKFEFKAQGAGTKVTLDQTGFPGGKFAGLDSGWHEHYWEPLKKYFA